jgi:hypothetical protein
VQPHNFYFRLIPAIARARGVNQFLNRRPSS